MKTKLPLLFAALFILICASTVAQKSARISMINPALQHNRHVSLINAETKISSTGCPANVIDYVYCKEAFGLDSNNTFGLLSIWPRESASTAFPNAHPVIISKLMFSGRLKPGKSAANKATLGLWTVKPGTYKPDSLLSSGEITIDTLGDDFYTVTLPTPITISDTFAVSLGNETCDTIDVYMTDPNHKQTQEFISFYYFEGSWQTMPAATFFETEVVLMPVVSYNLEANYKADAVTCVNTRLNVTNTSSSIYENRVFNRYQFDRKWVTGTSVDSTYAWDFGDSSAIVFEKNPIHTFSNPGTYSVSLTGSAQGYFFLGCTDIKTMNVIVRGDVASLFTIDSTKSPKIAFTNTSANMDTSTVYIWDFGDGMVSNDVNAVHSYSAFGTYIVTLKATGPCGSSTSMHTLRIKEIPTGINQFIPIAITTRIDQFGKNLTVTLSELPAASGQLAIYNLQGKLIANETMNTLSTIIHLGDIAAGSYIVRVQTSTGMGATRIAVFD